MAVKLNLTTDHAQMETELGVIDIWQIEGAELLTVEIFPPNQPDESFENGEFTNIWNALEVAVNMDFVKFTHRPKEWNWEQTCEMEQNAVTLIFEMLSTIQNLEDLKEVKLKDGTEVYESVKVIRNKYNNNYCSFCGCELTSDNAKEYAEELYCCESCFANIQNKTHLTDEEYNKAYAKGEEYLIKVAENNGWVQNEIFEESENQGNGYKYGLTLVGYEDEDHEVESGVISIDLAHLELFIPNYKK